MLTQKAIAWGITGAGHFLSETFDVMDKAVKVYNVKVTAYLTSAGTQVVRIYGLWNRLNRISNGGYLQEIFTEDEEGAGFPHAGRLLRGAYKALIVSPASGNTVAKIVHGIADTLVTNAVAQAQKGGVSVYIVPTDQGRGFIETALPYHVERSECKLCTPCPVISICPYSAVQVLDSTPKINLTLCQGCGLCLTACSFGAIKYGERIRLRLREVDVNNVKKLRKMKNVIVLRHPKQIEEVIKEVLQLH